MAICEARGLSFNQERPDVIPEGYQTKMELLLLSIYLSKKEKGNG